MAKSRYVGKSALVKVNTSGDGVTFVTVGLVRNITPPAEVKARIDTTAMEDTTAQTAQGIEELSEFTFAMLWDDADAGDEDVRELYVSGTAVAWQYIVTDGSNTWTVEFDGRVFNIEPQSFSGTDPVTANVTVVRTGAITDTFA